MHATNKFSNFGIENEFSALIFAYFPPHMGFKVIGQPLLSLGICAFFSRQTSRSSTVHLHNKRGSVIIGVMIISHCVYEHTVPHGLKLNTTLVEIMKSCFHNFQTTISQFVCMVACDKLCDKIYQLLCYVEEIRKHDGI